MNPNNDDDLPPTYEQSINTIITSPPRYDTFSSNTYQSSRSFYPPPTAPSASVPAPSAPPAYFNEPRFNGAYNNGKNYQGTTLHEVQHIEAKQEQYNIKHGISGHVPSPSSSSSSSSPEGQPHRRTRTRYQPFEYVDEDGMTKTFISPNTSTLPAVPPVCRETIATPPPPPPPRAPPTPKRYRYENEQGELDSYIPSQPMTSSYHTDPMEAESLRQRDTSSCSCCNGLNEMTSDEECEQVCKCVGVTLCVVCVVALCVLTIASSSNSSSSSSHHHHHHHHSDVFCCWNTGPIVSGQSRRPVYRCIHGHICTNTHHRHNNENDCC